jgi:hypothetical protein
MASQLPVAVVCRVLGAPRSSVSARRASASARGRPGPAASISDRDLVELIRQVLDASPLAGAGIARSGPGSVASTAYTSAANGCYACKGGRGCWCPSGSVAAAGHPP